MNDPQVIEAILALAAWCEKKGIAYIHLAEADWDDAPQVPADFRETLRATFSGTLIVAGNYTRTKWTNSLRRGWPTCLPLAARSLPTLTCRTGSGITFH
jgi:N-ethylmaleimide reductase